jgi:hypothetical protein
VIRVVVFAVLATIFAASFVLHAYRPLCAALMLIVAIAGEIDRIRHD